MQISQTSIKVLTIVLKGNTYTLESKKGKKNIRNHSENI